MPNFEKLDVFEISSALKVLECLKVPFVRSRIIYIQMNIVYISVKKKSDQKKGIIDFRGLDPYIKWAEVSSLKMLRMCYSRIIPRKGIWSQLF